MEEPGRLQSMGVAKSWTQLSNETTTTIISTGVLLGRGCGRSLANKAQESPGPVCVHMFLDNEE